MQGATRPLRTAALFCAILLLVLTGPVRAYTGDGLIETIRDSIQRTAQGYRDDPDAALEEIREEIATHPDQVMSALLDFTAGRIGPSGVEGGVAPRGLGARDSLDRFIRAVADDLARSGGSPRIRRLIERYLPAGPAGGVEGPEGDPLFTSRRLFAAGASDLDAGEPERAIDEFDGASGEAAKIDDSWFEMRAFVMRGLAELRAGRAAAAALTLSEGAGRAGRVSDPYWRSDALLYGGQALLVLDSPLDALDSFLESAALLRSTGDTPLVKRPLAGAAEACLRAGREAFDRGDARRARELAMSGGEYAKEAGEEGFLSRLLVLRADIASGAGNIDLAVNLLRDAMERFRTLADDAGMLEGASRLGDLLAPRLPAEAAGFLREAAEAGNALGQTGQAGELLVRSAEMARRSGAAREAEKSIRLGLSGEIGPLDLGDLDRLRLSKGHLLLQHGDLPGAIAAYAPVKGEGDVSREARWGEGVARLLLGDPAGAAERLTEALPPGRLPARSLLSALLEALERAGRDDARSALIERLSRMIPAGGTEVPDDSREQASVALVLLELGRFTPASELAVRLEGTDDPEALLDASALWRRLGSPEAAKRCAARAVDAGLDPVLRVLDPSFPARVP